MFKTINKIISEVIDISYIITGFLFCISGFRGEGDLNFGIGLILIVLGIERVEGWD